MFVFNYWREDQISYATGRMWNSMTSFLRASVVFCSLPQKKTITIWAAFYFSIIVFTLLRNSLKEKKYSVYVNYHSCEMGFSFNVFYFPQTKLIKLTNRMLAKLKSVYKYSQEEIPQKIGNFLLCFVPFSSKVNDIVRSSTS